LTGATCSFLKTGVNFILKDAGRTTITLFGKDEVYVLEPAPIMIQPRASFIVNGGADLLHTGVYKISCEKTGLVAEIQLAKKKLFRSQGTSIEGFIAKKGEESTPLVQIGGDWKDEMYFTTAGGGNVSIPCSFLNIDIQSCSSVVPA
jgi:hypothetical protein